MPRTDALGWRSSSFILEAVTMSEFRPVPEPEFRLKYPPKIKNLSEENLGRGGSAL
jgi:hypothetical protein